MFTEKSIDVETNVQDCTSILKVKLSISMNANYTC